MKMNLKKYKNQLSKANPMKTIKIIVIILIVAIGFKLYKKLVGFNFSFFGSNDEERKLTDREQAILDSIEATSIDDEDLTITELQAKQTADKLQKEIDYVVYYSVNDVKSLFVGKTIADKQQIIKKFGSRPFKAFVWSSTEMLSLREYAQKTLKPNEMIDFSSHFANVNNYV